MPDWFQDLQQEKINAQARQGDMNAPQTLRAEQEQTLQLTHQVQAEVVLTHFMQDAILDHPSFPNSTLVRTVTARGASTFSESPEPAPWSAPLDQNFLPATVRLDNGRFIVRIDWRIHLNTRTSSSLIVPFDIIVTITRGGVVVNSQPLQTLTPEALVQAIRNAFLSRNQAQMQARGGHRHRRHRHSRWNVKLLRRLFPGSRNAGLYVGVALVMILLAVAVGVILVGSGIFPP